MQQENEAGIRKTGGLIGGAVNRVKLAEKRQAEKYPERGKPLDGIKPGEWIDDGFTDATGYLPYNCPVRPLGYDGEHFYFVDTMGQVFNSGDGALGVERLQKLFAGHEEWLDWAFPAFDKGGKVTGFKSEMVRRALFAACRQRGAWSSTDMVRGRGAWRDSQGKLLLHCGDHMWIDGEIEDTGEYGDYLYVRRPRSMSPWADPVQPEDNPATEVVKILRTWNMDRGDVDAILMLGSIGVAMLGGALDWRPSLFIVGDAGTGKSELTGKFGLLKAILGRMMVSTTNASEAGLYQLVGHDSVPIAIDELEGEDGQDQAQRVIKMARDAASGSVRIRGGQNHKGVEFQAQSTFFFSGINPPPLPPASLTRLAIIQLLPLKATSNKAPVLPAAETVGPRLLRVLADGWDKLHYHLEDYSNILREHGHDSRGQKTFGTFLAVAHTMLGDEGLKALGLPYDDLSLWGQWLAADKLPELEGKSATWEQCLGAILTSVIDNFTGGQRRTVAQELERLREDREQGFNDTRDKLAAIDLGLHGTKAQPMLCIPNQSRILAKALTGTPFSSGTQGSWNYAFRRGEPGIVHSKIDVGGGRIDNRVTVAGRQVRCCFIDLNKFEEWQKR